MEPKPWEHMSTLVYYERHWRHKPFMGHHCHVNTSIQKHGYTHGNNSSCIKLPVIIIKALRYTLLNKKVKTFSHKTSKLGGGTSRLWSLDSGPKSLLFPWTARSLAQSSSSASQGRWRWGCRWKVKEKAVTPHFWKCVAFIIFQDTLWQVFPLAGSMADLTEWRYMITSAPSHTQGKLALRVVQLLLGPSQCFKWFQTPL